MLNVSIVKKRETSSGTVELIILAGGKGLTLADHFLSSWFTISTKKRGNSSVVAESYMKVVDIILA